MTTKTRVVFAAFLIALCSGCGTVMSHSGDADWPPHPYSGVTFDCQLTYQSVTDQHEMPFPEIYFFSFLDVPFSVVGDTVCLPYETYVYSKYHDPNNYY
jgi:uncharacterized protein YceK